MPFLSDNTPPERMRGDSQSMHPRTNGSMILTPDDLFEASGTFISQDEKGNPSEWKLLQPDSRDGRHVYVGTTPDQCRRQTDTPVAVDRPSHLINYELGYGALAPDASTPLVANLPRPEAPIIKLQPATNEGYPSTTTNTPMWLAFAYVLPSGVMTGASPGVSFQVANGQSLQVFLPAEKPDGIRYLAILLSEPGTGRANSHGRYRIQRIVDLVTHESDRYILSGPYRYDDRIVSLANRTELPDPVRPGIRRIPYNFAARPGYYVAKIIWSDDKGDTFAGDTSRQIRVPATARYNVLDKEGVITLKAGSGLIGVRRPEKIPKGVTGWKVRVYIQPDSTDPEYPAGWREVYDRFNDVGASTPFPLSLEEVRFSGWGESGYYGSIATVICRDAPLPTENTTGVQTPQEAPQEPQAFGSARPDPDTYYIRVTDTDTETALESLPSVAVPVTVATNQIMNVLFTNPPNRIKNPTFIETDPNNLPLNWSVDQTGGSIYVENKKLVMQTNDNVTTATPIASTEPEPLVAGAVAHMEGRFTIKDPATGGPAKGAFTAELVQLAANGTEIRRDLLISASASGAHAFHGHAGAGQTYAWTPTTTAYKILYAFTGATKNMLVEVESTSLRDHEHSPRQLAASENALPAPSRDSYTALLDPPTDKATPVDAPAIEPDRPVSTGIVRAQTSFDSVIPPEYAVVTTGGATASAAPVAATDGGNGLLSEKTTAGSLASAYIERAFAHPVANRDQHAAALKASHRVSTWPLNGSVSMDALCRPSDKAKFAWISAASEAEKNELTINSVPADAGSVAIDLNGVRTTVPVTSVKDTFDLTVAAPTAPGTINITTEGASREIYVGGTALSFYLKITTVPTTSGFIYLTMDGITRSIYVKPNRLNRLGRRVPSNTNYIAYLIVRAGFAGYTVSRTNNTIYFTANAPGPRSAPSFSPGSTRTGYSLVTTQAGAAETAAELCNRIKATNFLDYTLTQGAGTNIVRFTAKQAGAKLAPTTNARATGATMTRAVVQAGSIDTVESLATRIRNTAFTGYTIEAGSDNRVVFNADTVGYRAYPYYSDNGTRAYGNMKRLRTGADKEIHIHVRDATGAVRSRRMLSGLTSTTIFNVDLAVSGAGTSRAVVSCWASKGSAALELMERFDEVDLTGYPAGHHKVGVESDSAASLTWSIHTDALTFTDRGLRHHRDHDDFGRWLPQVFAYYEPNQPNSDRLFLKSPEKAVVPGGQYTASIFMRANVHPSAGTIKPMSVWAIRDDGQRVDMGDLTNTGLSGKTAWTEHSRTFTVPPNCYTVYLAPSIVGAADIAAQEAVLSPGPVAKRTARYQTFGTYSATFRLLTPEPHQSYTYWQKQRLAIEALTNADTGQSLSVEYRTAQADPANLNIPGPWSAWTSDPATLPEADYVQILFTATGPGDSTPEIPNGSPSVEWVLKATSTRRMSTLLRADRQELPGGTAFAMLKGHSTRPVQQRRRLPNGRLHDDPKLFKPIGHLPECELLVFTEAAREHIESNWLDPYVIEEFGYTALTVLLSEQPEFERETITVTEGPNRSRHSIWKTKLSPMEVVSKTPIP